MPLCEVATWQGASHLAVLPAPEREGLGELDDVAVAAALDDDGRGCKGDHRCHSLFPLLHISIIITAKNNFLAEKRKNSDSLMGNYNINHSLVYGSDERFH